MRTPPDQGRRGFTGAAAGNSPETRKAMPGPEENAGQATERAGAQ